MPTQDLHAYERSIRVREVTGPEHLYLIVEVQDTAQRTDVLDLSFQISKKAIPSRSYRSAMVDVFFPQIVEQSSVGVYHAAVTFQEPGDHTIHWTFRCYPNGPLTHIVRSFTVVDPNQYSSYVVYVPAPPLIEEGVVLQPELEERVPDKTVWHHLEVDQNAPE